MVVRPETQQFYVQPILNDIFRGKELGALGTPERATSPPTHAPAGPPLALNRLSQFVSSTAAAATQRRSSRVGATSPTRALPVEHPGDLSLAPSAAQCAAGYGNNLYIGTSDGHLLWYVIEQREGLNEALSYVLRARQPLSPRRPANKILILPPIGKLLVLSEGVLQFFYLPNLDPVPNNVITPIRGVVTVALDDQEVALQIVDTSGTGMEMSVCVVKKKTVALYRLGTRMSWIQDIPVPETPLQVVRAGPTLCLADSSKYCVIDLTGPHLIDILPISQALPPDPEDEHAFHPEACIAVLPGEEEFLFCSYLGEGGSMGVFVDKGGDAVRGTITWPSHPQSLAIEGSSVIALLHDSTIMIHSIASIQAERPDDYPPQIIPFPRDLGARCLSSNPYGIMIAHHERDEKMRIISIPLMMPSQQQARASTSASRSDNGSTPPTDSIASDQSGSLLTQAMQRTASQSRLPLGPFTTTVAETLLVMTDSIVAIAALAWVIKAEQLLDAGQTEDCVRLVEEERRKSKRGEIDGDRATHSADLRYIHTRLALTYLKESLFEDAIGLFTRAKTDPRVVCRMFPDLVGNAIQPEDELQIWQGLEQAVEQVPDLQKIVVKTARTGGVGSHQLIDTSDPDNPEELEKMVYENFKIIFKEYLRKTRNSRRKSPLKRPVEVKIDKAVDTCLVKLLAQSGEIDEMASILSTENDCLLDELEPFLVQAKQPWILSRVLLQLGRIDKVLEILVDIIDGVTPDPRAQNPLEEVYSRLSKQKDPTLLRKYGLWLVKKDADMGLKIFTSQDARAGVRFDDRSLIADLRQIDVTAANHYLEHAVVQRRSADKQLHDALANYLLDQCEQFLADDGVRYHFTEIYEEYISNRPSVTYFTYFADLAQDSPSKTVRLQTILFLQGSPFYDVNAVADRLERIELLTYETAIVLGRLGKHSRALKLLALTLKDSVSAETYCSQGGEVLPPKIARAVVARFRYLEPWAALGEVGRRKRGTVSGEVRQMLVLELLKAYMSDGEASSKQTAALLNAQALHLDVSRVMEMVQPDWPLSTVSDFVGRSLRRQLHDRTTWQILKAVSAGQNMQIAERYAAMQGKRQPIIRFNDSDPSFSPPDEGSIPDHEYTSMTEKGFHFGIDSEKEKSPITEEPVTTINAVDKDHESALEGGVGIDANVVTHRTT